MVRVMQTREILKLKVSRLQETAPSTDSMLKAIELARDGQRFVERMQQSVDDLELPFQEKFKAPILDFRGKRLISPIDRRLVLQWTAFATDDDNKFHGSAEAGYVQLQIWGDSQNLTKSDALPIFPLVTKELSLDEFNRLEQLAKFSHFELQLGDSAILFYCWNNSPKNRNIESVDELSAKDRETFRELLRAELLAVLKRLNIRVVLEKTDSGGIEIFSKNLIDVEGMSMYFDVMHEVPLVGKPSDE